MQIILYFRTKEKTEKSSRCCYFQSVIPLFSDSTRKSLKHLHTGGLLWSFSQIFLSEGISARSSCNSIKATQLVLARPERFIFQSKMLYIIREGPMGPKSPRSRCLLLGSRALSGAELTLAPANTTAASLSAASATQRLLPAAGLLRAAGGLSVQKGNRTAPGKLHRNCLF